MKLLLIWRKQKILIKKLNKQYHDPQGFEHTSRYFR